MLAGWTSSFFAGAGGSKDKSVKECKGVLTEPLTLCVFPSRWGGTGV